MIRQEERSDLERHKFFSWLSPDNRRASACRCIPAKISAHLELVEEGERADFLHVVIDGSVEIFETHWERETTLEIIRPPREPQALERLAKLTPLIGDPNA